MKSPAWWARICARSRTGCRRRAGWSRSSATSQLRSHGRAAQHQPRTTSRRWRRLFDRFEFRAWRQELGDDMRHWFRATAHGARIRDRAAARRQLAELAGADRVSAAGELSTPKPRASIRSPPSWSVSRSSIEPGKAAYIPLAHRYAGAPEQLDRGRRRWRSSSPGSRTRQRAKVGAEREVSPARARQPRHRAVAASRTTRCWNPTCWRVTGRTTWTAWRSVIWA